MPLTLSLGVIDVPYAPGPVAPRRAVARIRKGKLRTRTAAAAGQQTTGDVAEILEEKYHIMESFAEEYHDQIVDAVAHSLAGAMETILSGQDVENPFAGAESEITEGMKEFIDGQMMDGIPGVPTKAALKGINHRLTHPYAKGNPARPSFLDTGLFQANMVATIEES